MATIIEVAGRPLPPRRMSLAPGRRILPQGLEGVNLDAFDHEGGQPLRLGFAKMEVILVPVILLVKPMEMRPDPALNGGSPSPRALREFARVSFAMPPFNSSQDKSPEARAR